MLLSTRLKRERRIISVHDVVATSHDQVTVLVGRPLQSFHVAQIKRPANKIQTTFAVALRHKVRFLLQGGYSPGKGEDVRVPVLRASFEVVIPIMDEIRAMRINAGKFRKPFSEPLVDLV